MLHGQQNSKNIQLKFIKILDESRYSSVLRCCVLSQRAPLNDVCGGVT